jgi:maleate isomerase
VRDYLGWRRMFGVATPSPNTCVQPEYDAMRPPGVTNHISRIYIEDRQVETDEDFAEALDHELGTPLDDAIDRVMTCKPDHFILGVSALTVWGGSRSFSDALKARIKARAGVEVTLASDAIIAGLRAHGVKKRIAIVEPYFPIIQPRIEAFFAEFGYEIVRFNHMRGRQFTHYTHVTARSMIESLRSIDSPDVEALVPFGANYPMARIADEAERWLDKPVIAVNVATYWHALRQAGIDDKVVGFTRLLSDF